MTNASPFEPPHVKNVDLLSIVANFGRNSPVPPLSWPERCQSYQGKLTVQTAQRSSRAICALHSQKDPMRGRLMVS
jgi:hypothetical protein